MKRLLFILLFFSLLSGLFISCEKPAGPGGKAVIKGKVYAKNFDSYGYTVISEYYIPAENVYICYGSDNTVRNDVNTSDDGSFEFLYLNKGHYKVFVESRDTSIHVKNSKKTITASVEIDISSVNQTVTLNDLIMNK
ncbi:MAG: hypothetical protein ACXVPN_12225 [Bacteroidia bacterium]